MSTPNDPQVDALNTLISTAPQGFQLLLNDPELLAGLDPETLAILSSLISKQERLFNRIYMPSDGPRIRNDVFTEAERRGLTFTPAQKADALQLIRENLFNENRSLGDPGQFLGAGSIEEGFTGDTLSDQQAQGLMAVIIDTETFTSANPAFATFERQISVATDVAETLGKITPQEANALEGLPAEKVRQVRVAGELTERPSTDDPLGLGAAPSSDQEGAFSFLQEFDSNRFDLLNSGQFTSGVFPLDLFRAAQADTPESISTGTNLFPVSANHPSRIEGATKQQRLEELLGPEAKNVKPGIEFLLQDAGLPHDPQSVEEGPTRQALTRAINELTALAETNRNQLMASTLRADPSVFTSQMTDVINDFITAPPGQQSQFEQAQEGLVEEQRAKEARESIDAFPTTQGDLESLVGNRMGSLKGTVTDDFFQAIVSSTAATISQIQKQPKGLIDTAASGGISADLLDIVDRTIDNFLTPEALSIGRQALQQEEAREDLQKSVETPQGIQAAIERALGGTSLTAGSGDRVGGPGLRGEATASPQAQQIARQNILNRIFNKLSGPISEEIQTALNPDLPGVVDRVLSEQDKALLGNIDARTGARVPGGIPTLPPRSRAQAGQPALDERQQFFESTIPGLAQAREAQRQRILPVAAQDEQLLNLTFPEGEAGFEGLISELGGDDFDLQNFARGRLPELLRQFQTSSRETALAERASLRDRDISRTFNEDTGRIETTRGARRRPTIIPGQPQSRTQSFDFSEFFRGRSEATRTEFEASPAFARREEQRRRALLRGSGPARFLPRVA